MNDPTTAGCPRIEDISALLDGELTDGAGAALRAHAAACPLCGATLRAFESSSAQLRTLRQTHSDVDIAALVSSRLPPRVAPRPRRRPWHGWWGLLPSGVGAAAALAAGAYLGLLLVAGAGPALWPAAMTVFDAAPPGALCAGLPSCSPRGR